MLLFYACVHNHLNPQRHISVLCWYHVIVFVFLYVIRSSPTGSTSVLTLRDLHWILPVVELKIFHQRLLHHSQFIRPDISDLLFLHRSSQWQFTMMVRTGPAPGALTPEKERGSCRAPAWTPTDIWRRRRGGQRACRHWELWLSW